MKKITVLPRPDSRHRTQEEWINFFNTEKQRMISVPDTFQIAKENNVEDIESLRKDFKDYWLVTSTRIIYNPRNLSATIMHNANSSVTKQTEINLKEVPVCRPTYIRELLETDAGLSYIRALLNDTKATKEQIINLFEALSGKKANKIRFWTPTQSQRSSRQVRSVGLYFDFGWFDVGGYGWFDFNEGLSRGVFSGSAKQSQFFSNRAVFNTENETITIPMTKKLLKDIEKKQSSSKKVRISWKLEVQLK